MQTEMKASHELDLMVAEKVMGWKRSFDDGWNTPAEGWVGFVGARFSTDISAAWKVVEKMLENHRYGMQLFNVGTKAWSCKFFSGGKEWWNCDDGMCYDHSAAHAICLAALRAVEGRGK